MRYLKLLFERFKKYYKYLTHPVTDKARGVKGEILKLLEVVPEENIREIIKEWLILEEFRCKKRKIIY